MSDIINDSLKKTPFVQLLSENKLEIVTGKLQPQQQLITLYNWVFTKF